MEKREKWLLEGKGQKEDREEGHRQVFFFLIASSTGLTSEGNQTSNKVLAFAVFKKKNFWFCRV
jgi:hypothetical protein